MILRAGISSSFVGGAGTYRRLFVLLRREGEPSGINRIYRLDREEGLTVRKRRARRRAVGARAPILVAARPNARWSIDFVHDQFACGRRFRVLTIVDDVTRECLAAIPDTSISGRRVARELTDLIKRRGKPEMIVSDHGTEFTSNAILAWPRRRGRTFKTYGPPRLQATFRRLLVGPIWNDIGGEVGEDCLIVIAVRRRCKPTAHVAGEHALASDEGSLVVDAEALLTEGGTDTAPAGMLELITDLGDRLDA
ncbi:putative transposase [Aurantimonas manganoxydans SI85-9A1]|uniref:Putative transposase n=1 Tax=Aurantimonas manganoxydans (strain ATCC BAA-1229 / DSM 21871 / SI85-9A1) TaxID=287752 RepID=Q1YMB7_AURMS|nr:putative transposase [Aurantimonas manganoxydans SI85-9A1]